MTPTYGVSREGGGQQGWLTGANAGGQASPTHKLSYQEKKSIVEGWEGGGGTCSLILFRHLLQKVTLQEKEMWTPPGSSFVSLAEHGGVELEIVCSVLFLTRSEHSSSTFAIDINEFRWRATCLVFQESPYFKGLMVEISSHAVLKGDCGLTCLLLLPFFTLSVKLALPYPTLFVKDCSPSVGLLTTLVGWWASKSWQSCSWKGSKIGWAVAVNPFNDLWSDCIPQDEQC